MAAEVARYWRHEAVDGVDLLRARFLTHRYGRHSHETYTFGLIEAGVEEFDYGSDVFRAGAGAVALLDPDVVHTGQAATPAGWRSGLRLACIGAGRDWRRAGRRGGSYGAVTGHGQPSQ